MVIYYFVCLIIKGTFRDKASYLKQVWVRINLVDSERVFEPNKDQIYKIEEMGKGAIEEENHIEIKEQHLVVLFENFIRVEVILNDRVISKERYIIVRMVSGRVDVEEQN